MSVLDKANKTKLFDVECSVIGMLGVRTAFVQHVKRGCDVDAVIADVQKVSTLYSLNQIIEAINRIIGDLNINKAQYTRDYTGSNGQRFITITFISHERDFMACREIDKKVVGFDFQLDASQEEAFRTLVTGAFPYEIEKYVERFSQW